MKDHVYDGEHSLCGKSWWHWKEDDTTDEVKKWKRSRNKCRLCVRVVKSETKGAAR